MLNLNGLILVITITTIAALGTMLGAFFAFLIVRRKKKPSKALLKFIVALGGGVLLSAVSLVLIPEGTRVLSSVSANCLFLLGSITFMGLDIWLEKLGNKASQIMANTMDSIPESVGIGAAFAVGGSVGPLLAVLVGLQNVSEGFNSYDELRSGGATTKNNFLIQFLSSLSGPIAGVIGFVFLANHPKIIAELFMFSAGGILYLIFHDIAPLAHQERHWVPVLGSSIGFSIGLVSQALVG